MKTRTLALAGAALIACAPVAAIATTTATTDPLAVEPMDDDADDGDKGLWGLLGLLGLFAPLFNKKNNDTVHVNRTTTSGRNDGNPLT